MKKLPSLSIAELETSVLSFWKTEQIFEKSLAKNKSAEIFSFYDGPPFANGQPHFGHSLVTAIKDAIGRYKTMQGYYVPRRNGWDCHGLPVEYEIEKKFNVSGKKQILELGLDTFNAACRDSVFTYKKDWEAFFERIGRWSDIAHSYATMDNDYIESVWWVLAQLHKKGLLYRGYKSMPYCPRCETPLSNFELNEGYKDNTPDPSLYVKFKLVDRPCSLLAWTTTPWSLPGNAALALNPAADYVEIKLTDEPSETETLILAKKRLSVLDEKYTVVKHLKASELVGQHYEPLFKIDHTASTDSLYQIWEADFVSIEEGTGVLHIAPAFGEDDLNLAQQHHIPVLTTVKADGTIDEMVGIKDLVNIFFKSADAPIIAGLKKSGRVFAAESHVHTYPFCYRCESPLLYYAISTWFIRVSGMRQELVKTAQSVNWTPSHVKEGRFGQWLNGARDWAISRNRYWGSPLPIWLNEKDDTDYIVVESLAELEKMARGKVNLNDLHRPMIDEVVIEKDGKTYRRATEVLDCWFESGSMPYAQQHYPFENKELFSKLFPADYIGEGLDQTHLWFYVLHVISTALFNKPAYQNVIVNGMIMAADGQKLSKRLKNYPPLEEVFQNEGADSLRYYLLSSPATVGEYMRFSRDGLRDIKRNVFMTLYNTVSFFTMYAELDGFEPTEFDPSAELSNPLDRWLLARLSQTVEAVTNGADSFDLGKATRPIEALIDDMSNWYVRRSRRRFWKSENDKDKQQAYQSLYFSLITIVKILAPWAPFMSEFLYQALRSNQDLPESVHLCDWPTTFRIDNSIISEMEQARELISQGLAKRASAKIKVRQPLASAVLYGPHTIDDSLLSIIAEELNVKIVKQNHAKEPALTLETTVTPELKQEGLARDVIRFIQASRKKQGFNVEDRIQVRIAADKQLSEAITKHRQLIADEVLATNLEIVDTISSVDAEQTIDSESVALQLEKS